MSDQYNKLKKKTKYNYVKNMVSDTPKRVDWEIIKINNGKSFTIIPHPERYEKVDLEGENYYKDKFTGDLISNENIEILKNATLKDLIPTYTISSKFGSYEQYKHKVREELNENWENEIFLPDPQNPIENYFKSRIGKEEHFVILFVDLEGSTNLSANFDPHIYLKINKIFIEQMAQVLDNYGAFILKYVGDAVIGVFPSDENYLGMCDNAIRAAMAMIGIIEEVINPILIEKGFPKIACHIGIDMSGPIVIDNIGVKNIANLPDLIGYSMNLTAKIQSKAGHNEILIGEHLFQNLHYSFQKFAERIDLESWNFRDPLGQDVYKIYKFKGNFSSYQ